MFRERGAGLNNPSPRNIQVGLPGLASAPLSDIRAGFRSGFVIEIRDSRRPTRPVAVHSFALNPQRYTLSEPYQSTLTPTEDNSVTAEENGPIIREITIEGTFGLSRKRGPSFRGDQGSLTGNEHFVHLRNLFRQYGRIKQEPAEAAYHSMVFHALRDDDHFIVVPRAFETARDAKSTRFHYPYRITLAAIGETTYDTGLLRAPEFLRTLSKAFHTARAAFAEANSLLSEMKAQVASVGTVLSQAAELINAVGEVFTSTADLINYPLELAADVLTDLSDAADQLAVSTTSLTPGSIQEVGSRNLRRLEAALDRIVSIPERFGPSSLEDTLERYQGEQGLTADDLRNQTAGAGIGSRTRLALGDTNGSLFDLRQYRGVLRERVDATTTITGLATQYDVPEALIVLVNDLVYPYLAPGGGPGLLKPGDAVLVPVRDAVGAGAQPGAKNSYVTPEEALYGIDMALDATRMAQEGRLDLKVAQNKLDVDLTRGIDNVIQGTEITVRTDRGSTIFVPEVGIRRSIGLKGTVQHLLLTALNLREGILADPRIEGIEDSRVVLEGDVLSQEITPRLRGNRGDINFVLPFGTATGAS